MKYIVTATSVDPSDPTYFNPPREEEIDTDENQLFYGCSSAWEVEDQYHRFWNRLNDSWEGDFPPGKDKVLVISVEQA